MPTSGPVALLPSRETAPQLAGMSTLTKPKKPARRAAAAAPISPSARLAARVRAGKFAEGADFKMIAATRLPRNTKTKLAGQAIQQRLVQIELATVSALRALQMDIDGDAGKPSAAVLKRARAALK